MTGGDGRFPQAGAVLVRLLGDLRRLVVADMRIQRRHQHQRAAHQLGNALAIGLDADGAVFVEAGHAVRQQPHALQEVVRNHRPEHIELEVAGSAADVDRHVVAEHLAAQHGDGFALGRVDLARHDRGAGFVFRNADLADPAARTAGQPADVVGDLHHARGHGFQRAMGMDQRIAGRHVLELVGGSDKRQSGQAGQFRRHVLGIARGCIQSRAHGGPAQRQLAQMRQRTVDVPVALLQLCDIAGEFLPERERGGVLQMSAADLDDVPEGMRLGIERGPQLHQGRSELAHQALHRGDVHRRGKHVVGRLAHVDVVVRMHQPAVAARPPQQLAGAVRQHLVDVHVGLRPGAGLPHHQGKLVGVLAFDDFIGGGNDRRRLAIVEQSQQMVHHGRGPFDLRQRPDQLARLALAGNVEIEQRTLGLGTPQALRGHLDRAEGISFNPCGHGGSG